LRYDWARAQRLKNTTITIHTSSSSFHRIVGGTGCVTLMDVLLLRLVSKEISHARRCQWFIARPTAYLNIRSRITLYSWYVGLLVVVVFEWTQLVEIGYTIGGAGDDADKVGIYIEW
jgi:hypothetical protein